MEFSTGDRLWAARMSKDGADWRQLALGEPLSAGGAGDVYAIAHNTTPPLVGKLYHSEIAERITRDRSYARRITLMASEGQALAEALPFAVWPRRLLFTRRDLPKGAAFSNVKGFTMARLENTVPLETFLEADSVRYRLTFRDTAFLAHTLADQLRRLHAHPWQFVFGDLSNRNVHISRDFKRVVFIDTDSYGYAAGSGSFAFESVGITPSFTSPYARGAMGVPREHDEFALAIHIFMLLMAHVGGAIHPFPGNGAETEQYISTRQFPFDQPQRYRVPARSLQTYQSLPPQLRGAFTQSFSGDRPLTAADWCEVMASFRRLLR